MLNVKWTDGSSCPLFISSIYNGAHDEPDLADKRLQELPVPVNAHWIIGGDFNRHHPDWSTRMAPSARPAQASALRATIAHWGLEILNDADVATRQSPEGGAATVLDLIMVSPTLSDLGMESTLDVSFQQATFSDHALLSFALPLEAICLDPFASNRLPKSALPRWQEHIGYLLPEVFSRPMVTTADLDILVEALHDACTHAMHLSSADAP